MPMEETSLEQHYRSMNYTTLDRCQDAFSIDKEESYRQLYHCNEHVNDEHKLHIQLMVIRRWHVLLLVFLILTSQCNALPIVQSLSSKAPKPECSLNTCLLSVNRYQPQRLVYLPPLPSPRPFDRSTYPPPSSFNSAKAYRHYSIPSQQQQQLRQPIPSYSNGAQVQISNLVYRPQQQQQPISSAMNNNVMNQQLQREQQRRAMIDKMLALFDDDGENNLWSSIEFSSFSLGNGQLTKDELYSMALRSNMFPKLHYYLKQTPI